MNVKLDNLSSRSVFSLSGESKWKGQELRRLPLLYRPCLKHLMSKFPLHISIRPLCFRVKLCPMHVSDSNRWNPNSHNLSSDDEHCLHHFCHLVLRIFSKRLSCLVLHGWLLLRNGFASHDMLCSWNCPLCFLISGHCRVAWNAPLGTLANPFQKARFSTLFLGVTLFIAAFLILSEKNRGSAASSGFRKRHACFYIIGIGWR